MNSDAVKELSIVLLVISVIAVAAWTFLVNLPERIKMEQTCKAICALQGKDLSKARSDEDGYTCWCTDAWKLADKLEEE